MYILFLLELIPQLKDLDLYLPLPVMFQDTLVRLALLVSQTVEVFGVRGGMVARLDMGEVALDVARSATASRCRETNVV